MTPNTKKRIIVIFTALIFLLSFLTASGSLAASDKTTIDEDYKELENIQGQYDKIVAARENAKKELEAIKNTLTKLEADKMSVEEDIVYIDDQITTLASLITAYEPIVASLSTDIEKLSKKLDEYLDNYTQIVRYSFIKGDASVFEIIFQSDSFSDFLTRLDFSTNILEYSQSLMDSIEESKEKLETSQQEYNNAIETLTLLKQDQEDLRTEQSDKLAQLDELQAEYAAKEQNKVDTITSMAGELKDIDDEIESLIALIQDKEYKASGNWARPLPSVWKRVSSPYGWRTLYGEPDYHYGIDFPCDTGTEVYAVEDGTVVMSEYRGGYGWLIVIYHGGGIQTYYAHNSKLLVSVNDTIVKGQLIAYSGNTGKSTGPHLHFGVKVNGVFVDPETKDKEGNFVYLNTSSFTSRAR
ncbi:MAG TPA: peptidoglycan DD-metalloendopeptidase family protein [Bacillota bacterium]|nr:peptidoglycan DD-metalloendopeptidase family protein [Bacillota bacterium]